MICIRNSEFVLPSSLPLSTDDDDDDGGGDGDKTYRRISFRSAIKNKVKFRRKISLSGEGMGREREREGERGGVAWYIAADIFSNPDVTSVGLPSQINMQINARTALVVTAAICVRVSTCTRACTHGGCAHARVCIVLRYIAPALRALQEYLAAYVAFSGQQAAMGKMRGHKYPKPREATRSSPLIRHFSPLSLRGCALRDPAYENWRKRPRECSHRGFVILALEHCVRAPLSTSRFQFLSRQSLPPPPSKIVSKSTLICDYKWINACTN